ncbi:MAG: hypothetical protein WCS42_11735 [Verrucomicrobiota bacterium]
MRNKATVTAAMVRGEKNWKVRFRDAGGNVKCKYFPGNAKVEANAYATELNGAAIGADNRLATLPANERAKLVFIYDEAQKRGVDTLSFLSASVDSTAFTKSPAVEDVLGELITSKESAGKNASYCDSLRCVNTAFIRGFERMPINKITKADVVKFLNSKNIRSRSTLRARLSALFMYGISNNYCDINPCDKLEKISLPKTTPTILTVEETEKCLTWLKVNPRAFGWFALSCFCGLRPEEAEKTTWDMINFAEGYVRVEASTTKVGCRRIVYPKAEAMKLLKAAKDAGATLPLPTRKTSWQKWKLCDVLGWEGWKQDVTRHTAASNWIAATGEVAAIATAMGNSETILRRFYMALVTKVDAARFWALASN